MLQKQDQSIIPLSTSCAMGRHHIIMWRANGAVFCSGMNHKGQLAIDRKYGDRTPLLVRMNTSSLGTRKIKDIAVGDSHTVIWCADNTVWICSCEETSGRFQTYAPVQMRTKADRFCKIIGIAAGGDRAIIFYADNTAELYPFYENIVYQLNLTCFSNHALNIQDSKERSSYVQEYCCENDAISKDIQKMRIKVGSMKMELPKSFMFDSPRVFEDPAKHMDIRVIKRGCDLLGKNNIATNLSLGHLKKHPRHAEYIAKCFILLQKASAYNGKNICAVTEIIRRIHPQFFRNEEEIIQQNFEVLIKHSQHMRLFLTAFIVFVDECHLPAEKVFNKLIENISNIKYLRDLILVVLARLASNKEISMNLFNNLIEQSKKSQHRNQ